MMQQQGKELVVETIGLTSARYHSAVFQQDLQRILVPLSCSLTAWDVQTNTRTHCQQVHTNSIFAIAENDTHVYTLAFNGEIAMLDRTTLAVLRRVHKQSTIPLIPQGHRQDQQANHPQRALPGRAGRVGGRQGGRPHLRPSPPEGAPPDRGRVRLLPAQQQGPTRGLLGARGQKGHQGRTHQGAGAEAQEFPDLPPPLRGIPRPHSPTRQRDRPLLAGQLHLRSLLPKQPHGRRPPGQNSHHLRPPKPHPPAVQGAEGLRGDPELLLLRGGIRVLLAVGRTGTDREGLGELLVIGQQRVERVPSVPAAVQAEGVLHHQRLRDHDHRRRRDRVPAAVRQHHLLRDLVHKRPRLRRRLRRDGQRVRHPVARRVFQDRHRAPHQGSRRLPDPAHRGLRDHRRVALLRQLPSRHPAHLRRPPRCLRHLHPHQRQPLAHTHLLEVDGQLYILAVNGMGYFFVFQLVNSKFDLILRHQAHLANKDADKDKFGSLSKFAECWSAAFSPLDASILATCSEDQTVHVYENGLKDPKLISVLEGHKLAVTCLDWKQTKLGTLLVSSSDDQTVRIYKTEKGFTLVRSISTSFVKEWHTLTYLALKENDKLLAIGSQNGYFFLYDLEQDEFIYADKIHMGGIEGLAWRDGLVSTCASDNTINLIKI